MAYGDEFNITGIFDGLFRGVAEKGRVPVEDYSAIFGGQLYGSLLDIVFDLTMQPAISGVVEGIVGAGTLLYSTMAEGVDPRLRKELFSMGTKLGLEVIDPRTWEAKKTSAEQVRAKIEEGDIVGALFKPPEDILKALGLKEKKPVEKVKRTKVKEEVSSVVEVPVESGSEIEEGQEEDEMWRKLSA